MILDAWKKSIIERKQRLDQSYEEFKTQLEPLLQQEEMYKEAYDKLQEEMLAYEEASTGGQARGAWNPVRRETPEPEPVQETAPHLTPPPQPAPASVPTLPPSLEDRPVEDAAEIKEASPEEKKKRWGINTDIFKKLK